MSISVDEVRHVAKLARLELDEAEILAFQSELNALLGHFQDIASLNVEGIEPKPHAVALRNVWADDVARPSLLRDEALRNAPVTRAGLFIVPQIIED
ncbi:MAG TPA: Asp-tRNA(Asn)/Glu-tRNA(Gln) amidotransferase subunit GatC [Fimbriimonadaceae bacterium]|nr:Asp-tRNA(Asn)/Glu-tRNA(Gln) amidotransferase subunit GatC [Fimbriimonadaceae bacterium]HRJ33853.1 Asp-tRNA(Asn)/Glu-tRNA(Gln) amidotransferase subunit GatC [Fimbriimonadaceae bacterium]